jgi:[acyl-carrier-protein] S-malonyltransferase
MQNAGKNNTGGMLAVLGATKQQIDHVCSRSKMLVPANYNSNDQIVLSGDSNSIQNAISQFKEIGIRRVIKLKTSGAFHSPLMKSARNSLTKVIKSIEFKNAKIPIYQNTYPFPETNAKNIKLKMIQS